MFSGSERSNKRNTCSAMQRGKRKRRERLSGGFELEATFLTTCVSLAL